MVVVVMARAEAEMGLAEMGLAAGATAVGGKGWAAAVRATAGRATAGAGKGAAGGEKVEGATAIWLRTTRSPDYGHNLRDSTIL